MSRIQTNKVRHIPPGFQRHLRPNTTSDMDESDWDESKREHPDDTDVDESNPDQVKECIQMILMWKGLI